MRISSLLSAAILAGVCSTASAEAIKDQYIVTLAKPLRGSLAERLSVNDRAQSAITEVGGGRALYTYTHAMQGFSIRLTPLQAQLLAQSKWVKTIEPDMAVQASTTQTNATWGLDRIDQAALPLNQTYIYPTVAGQGAHVYVVDTGINPNHSEFTGRVGTSRNFVSTGFLFWAKTDPNAWQDCAGHGTHVAATAAGTVYGVAKKATVHAVRVLNCSGSGATSSIIAGLDWVLQNHENPAVVNMSLGGTSSAALNTAVRNLVNGNVAVAVAAGNSKKDACSVSPASEASALTVGATDSADKQASYSNFGKCVDIYAPGTNILSADYSSNSASVTMSGTSMASPHVAGALALLRASNPSLSAATVEANLVGSATLNKITSLGAGSPNKLLFVTP